MNEQQIRESERKRIAQLIEGIVQDHSDPTRKVLTGVACALSASTDELISIGIVGLVEGFIKSEGQSA